MSGRALPSESRLRAVLTGPAARALAQRMARDMVRQTLLADGVSYSMRGEAGDDGTFQVTDLGPLAPILQEAAALLLLDYAEILLQRAAGVRPASDSMD